MHKMISKWIQDLGFIMPIVTIWSFIDVTHTDGPGVWNYTHIRTLSFPWQKAATVCYTQVNSSRSVWKQSFPTLQSSHGKKRWLHANCTGRASNKNHTNFVFTASRRHSSSQIEAEQLVAQGQRRFVNNIVMHSNNYLLYIATYVVTEPRCGGGFAWRESCFQDQVLTCSVEAQRWDHPETSPHWPNMRPSQGEKTLCVSHNFSSSTWCVCSCVLVKTSSISCSDKTGYVCEFRLSIFII